MNRFFRYSISFSLFLLLIAATGYSKAGAARIAVGSERTTEYLPLLKGRRVALLVNQTSRIGKVHLADSLKALGVDVRVIFAPEHGFRGDADAGAHVANTTDARTGIPVISL